METAAHKMPALSVGLLSIGRSFFQVPPLDVDKSYHHKISSAE